MSSQETTALEKTLSKKLTPKQEKFAQQAGIYILTEENETMLVRADGIYILTEEDVTMLKLIFNTLQATDKPTGNLLTEVLHNAYCGQV